jgi:hypothetical protein
VVFQLRSSSSFPIDDVDQSGTELKLKHALDVLVRSPDEVTTGDLRKANVILVDYQLNRWPGREDTETISLRPGNGVALAAVLRSQMEEHLDDQRRAFAIHSGKLADLSGGLPASQREHAIARALNLEWVFSKRTNTEGPAVDVQVASLAAAVKRLPKTWPVEVERAQRVVERLLGIPTDLPWGKRAIADVESCHPPIHAWAAATNGMAFIRWLLHQVLPFPSFLWEDRYLAARLRVTVDSLRNAWQSNRRAQKALRPFKYHGVLADFLGRRWWRAGVEDALWEWTDGNPFDNEIIRDAVRDHVAKSLVPLQLNRPVVCVDPQSFRPTDDVIDVADAVEVRPDDWPAYAEQAWIAVDRTSDDAVAGLVVSQDRERIEGS